jgi:hypothetical protein
MRRLLPVVFIIGSAVAYVFDTEGADGHVWRNTVPLLIVLLLAAVTLRRGGGTWTGNGWRWSLGTLGFAVPAVGLSLYLHHGYATDMNGMVSDAMYPEELFRYLPVYTTFAGAIGFAIGWIVGRNV